MNYGQISTITRRIFFQSDTTTIRILLATASLGWTVVLLGNYLFSTPVMVRAPYGVMSVLGRDVAWAIVFLLHFLGVIWRLYDPKPRPVAALMVNAYGFAIWTLSTAAINISIGLIQPGSALEWTMCCASAWALYRTGLQPEAVSP